MAISKVLILSCVFLFSISNGLPVTITSKTASKGVTRTLKSSDVANMFSPESPKTLESLSKGPINFAAPFKPIGISLQGGQVMSIGIKVYIIWYGNWNQSSKDIITNFTSSLGPLNNDTSNSVRRWWKINGLYYNTSNLFPSQTITIAKQVTDNYSYGKINLSKTNIVYIVYNQMAKAKLPFDTNGIYLVLSSPDVYVSII